MFVFFSSGLCRCEDDDNCDRAPVLAFFRDATAHHVRGRQKAEERVGTKCRQEADSAGPFSRRSSEETMQRRCGHSTRLPSMLLLCFLCALVPTALFHPQCLDFKPPFRPLRELEFCVMYKEFGCCDHQRDQELMSKYYQIMDRFDSEGFQSCAGYVLDLLCQVGMRTKVAGSPHNVTHKHNDRAARRVQLSLCDQLWTESCSLQTFAY